MSPMLKELAVKYLAMVDEPDGHTSTHERDAERTGMHNALIAQSIIEELVPEIRPSRAKIRWLARYLLASEQAQLPAPFKRQYLMFARDGYMLNLCHVPPFDEKEERAAMQFYTPVKVTIESILEAADENIK